VDRLLRPAVLFGLAAVSVVASWIVASSEDCDDWTSFVLLLLSTVLAVAGAVRSFRERRGTRWRETVKRTVVAILVATVWLLVGGFVWLTVVLEGCL
jgi:1,4-dihydroxy-2-naphthoate octaprenyltransferase